MSETQCEPSDVGRWGCGVGVVRRNPLPSRLSLFSLGLGESQSPVFLTHGERSLHTFLYSTSDSAQTSRT